MMRRRLVTARATFDDGDPDRRRFLGHVLADMALLTGCTRTFEYEYLRRRLAELDWRWRP